MLSNNWQSLRQIVVRVLLILLVWRCSLFIFDFFGLSLTEERVNNNNKDWQAFPSHYFFDGFFRWDGGWYNRIAKRGYYFEASQSDVAFFPLYPYLSRFLGYIFGNHFIAGWLISNVSLFGGLVYIYRIGLLYFDRKAIERSLVLLLLFPSSLFFSAYYTEALFLFTCTSSFYYFLTQNYFRAGLLGMLAALTRSAGILLLFSFAADILYHRWREKQPLQLSMGWLLLIPLGLVIFILILYVQVNDPLAFIKAEDGWGKSSTFPLWTLLITLTNLDYSFPRNQQNVQMLFDLMTAVGFLAISLMMVIRKYRLSFCVFVALGVLLPLSTGIVVSMMRYCIVLFPAFFYLAQLARRPIVYHYLLFSFSLLQWLEYYEYQVKIMRNL